MRFVSRVHCRLHVSRGGDLVEVEAVGASGVWVDCVRVLQGDRLAVHQGATMDIRSPGHVASSVHFAFLRYIPPPPDQPVVPAPARRVSAASAGGALPSWPAGRPGYAAGVYHGDGEFSESSSGYGSSGFGDFADDFADPFGLYG